MLSRNRWLSALLLSFVAVLLVVGCGGGDDESEDGGGEGSGCRPDVEGGLEPSTTSIPASRRTRRPRSSS